MIRLQGDPLLIMGPDGTYLQFVGGQPLTDRGLENLVLISLFTSPGWCGNAFMKTVIGSDFEAACNAPITRQSLNRIRAAAEKALANPAFGRVAVVVENPTGYRIKVSIRLQPPADSPLELTLTREGANWFSQASEPAYQEQRSTPWQKPLAPGGSAPFVFEGEDGALLEF